MGLASLFVGPMLNGACDATPLGGNRRTVTVFDNPQRGNPDIVTRNTHAAGTDVVAPGYKGDPS